MTSSGNEAPQTEYQMSLVSFVESWECLLNVRCVSRSIWRSLIDCCFAYTLFVEKTIDSTSNNNRHQCLLIYCTDTAKQRATIVRQFVRKSRVMYIALKQLQLQLTHFGSFVTELLGRRADYLAEFRFWLCAFKCVKTVCINSFESH